MSNARRLTLVSVAAFSVAAWGVAEEALPAVFTPTSKDSTTLSANSGDSAGTTNSVVAQTDARDAGGLNIVPTQMEAVRVHDSRLEARRLESLGNLLRVRPPSPSLDQGNLLLRKKIGKIEAEIGPQPWRELFSQEANFSTGAGLPRVELVHFRF